MIEHYAIIKYNDVHLHLLIKKTVPDILLRKKAGYK